MQIRSPNELYNNYAYNLNLKMCAKHLLLESFATGVRLNLLTVLQTI